MDRRPLQLLAAFALVVSLLGVSTALVAEVREEVLAAQRAASDISFTPPSEQAAGLPISEFTLLDAAPARLNGVDRDRNVLQLREQGTILFSEGDRIRVSPILMPGPTQVEFPRGGSYSGSQISCPDGCVLYGEQGQMAAPPNASIVLPGTTRLPIPQGEIDRGESYELAPGARLFLAPITMSRDTPLPLTPGTTITVPEGQAGDLDDPSGRIVELPAGTVVRGAPEEGPPVERLLQENPSTPPEIPEELDTTRPVRPDIEVTQVPETIHKGRPFNVEGTITLPDGSPSVGHPVILYANATKEAPGFEIQIGQVRTDENGAFHALATIPREKATQPYHIVAKAQPRLDHDPPLLEAWSDPVVGVEGTPELILDIPEQEGRNIPVTFQARLQDEYGAPIPNQLVTFHAQGTGSFPIGAITDKDGQALAIFKDGFPGVGTYNVSARFDGADHLPATSAFDHIQIVDASIVTDATMVVPRGQSATLNGQVLVEGAPARNVDLEARYADRTARTTTDDRGVFQLHFEVPGHLAVGNHTMRLETEEGVTASRSVVLTVTGQARLDIQQPGVLPLGGTLPLQVKVTDERGVPLDSREVTATTASGTKQGVLTGSNGQAVVPASLSSTGTWNLTVATPDGHLYAGATETVPLRVGPPNVLGDIRLTPGQTRNVSLQLVIQDRPFAQEPVELRGPGFVTRGTTDDKGRVLLPARASFLSEPGSVELELALQRYNVVHHLQGTVLEQPRLDVQVLGTGASGGPLVLEVAATGKDGVLAGLPLTVQAHGAFQATQQAVTGADGTVQVELDRPRSAEGQAVLTVTAERTGTTSEAVQVASAQLTSAPFPWWVLVPIGLIAALGVGLWRYRRREPQQVVHRGPQLDLAITPQHEEGLPPVWHTEEATTLHLRLLTEAGHPISGAEVHLSGPHGRATITLDEAGRAQVPVPAGHGDVLNFHAEFHGTQVHPPTEADLEVRLVDYREEIDREYQRLKTRTSELGRCGIDATPRELARAYGDKPEAAQLALLFERCDYSPRPVSRTDYVSFMKAKEALTHHGPDPHAG